MESDMKLLNCWGLLALFVLAFGLVLPVADASQLGSERGQSVLVSECSENLAHLEGEMEDLLKSVHVQEFRETMRRSLRASIPEAVSHIDGLTQEIDSLKREIQHQVRVEKSAEFILRDITKTSDGPFKPCRRTEEGGYCETLERYYMAKAANLANLGFLQALECHQDNGKN